MGGDGLIIDGKNLSRPYPLSSPPDFHRYPVAQRYTIKAGLTKNLSLQVGGKQFSTRRRPLSKQIV
jgi:hypothetical protein